MRRNRKVKILATLGPASSSAEMIEKLFVAGVDVFRINMSHTSHAMLAQLHGCIRNVERKLNRPIGILADLQGPKIRIGTFNDKEVQIKAGDTFAFDTDATPGDSKRVHLPHPEIFASVKVGDFLLLNDGRSRVEITAVSPNRIDTVIIFGGTLSNRKGVNLPNTLLPIPALTEKDRADLEAAASIGVDWIALSFVQRPEDVVEARGLIANRAGVMAKIEKPSALLCLEDILKVSDGIMVARGDLGVELPLETVPARQKQLTRAARRAGKPVVVATQMLESMIVEPVPTRAEVSDVATAVYEGADAIMLSAESAAGAFPIEAVMTMNNVAISVESDPTYRQVIEASRTANRTSIADAIVAAAREIAETTNIKAICCFSQSGTTVSLVARERPRVPILALTPLMTTARRMILTWGTTSEVVAPQDRFKGAVIAAIHAAVHHGFADEKEFVVVTAGVPFNVEGSTNILRVAPCDERLIHKGDAE